MKPIKDWLSSPFQAASEYRLASWWFLRLLALIYLFAFLSLSGQITGLVGSEGILPLELMLENASRRLGDNAWLYLPTLFWLDGSNITLTAATWLGCAFSVALFE